jgi:hypothetical protein
MTQDEIDIMWQKAMQESIKEGAMFTRYHFAKLVAEAEREACAKVAERFEPDEKTSYVTYASTTIRARGQA